MRVMKECILFWVDRPRFSGSVVCPTYRIVILPKSYRQYVASESDLKKYKQIRGIYTISLINITVNMTILKRHLQHAYKINAE